MFFCVIFAEQELKKNNQKRNAMEFYGSLRITNQNTLNRWKLNGKYKELIDQGYFYAHGCGRFTKQICKCTKCKKNRQINDEFDILISQDNF